jgi:hypothetical protein
MVAQASSTPDRVLKVIASARLGDTMAVAMTAPANAADRAYLRMFLLLSSDYFFLLMGR